MGPPQDVNTSIFPSCAASNCCPHVYRHLGPRSLQVFTRAGLGCLQGAMAHDCCQCYWPQVRSVYDCVPLLPFYPISIPRPRFVRDASVGGPRPRPLFAKVICAEHFDVFSPYCSYYLRILLDVAFR